MGIRDWFKRNKIENENEIQQTEQEKKYPQITLGYSNGTTANVKFKEVVDYQLENGKGGHLQQIEIMYEDQEQQFHVKKCYIDPIPFQDESGKYFYDSAKYFQNLNKENPNLVRSFFDRNSISKLPSDYIGGLSIFKDGRKPCRSFNQINGFYTDYITEYKRKLREREQTQAERFAAENAKHVNKPHELVAKTTSYAEKLTHEMYKEMYGNR